MSPTGNLLDITQAPAYQPHERPGRSRRRRSADPARPPSDLGHRWTDEW